MKQTIQTTETRKQYIGSNFMLTVFSAKKGGVLTEIIDGRVQVGNDIDISDSTVEACIKNFKLVDPIVCVKWN